MTFNECSFYNGSRLARESCPTIEASNKGCGLKTGCSSEVDDQITNPTPDAPFRVQNIQSRAPTISGELHTSKITPIESSCCTRGKVRRTRTIPDCSARIGIGSV